MAASAAEAAVAGSGPSAGPVNGEEQVRVRRRTLEAVLEQCRQALELLQDAKLDQDPAGDAAAEEEEKEEEKGEEEGYTPRSPSADDQEIDELCDLLKSKVESSDFLEKLGSNHKSVFHSISADENASWDMVSTMDLWEDKQVDDESDPDGYVLVRQEDIVEGIASFMAAYLLSLKQTKELTPNELQEGEFCYLTLSKTFAVKKKKSRLRKAWDGSKVIYNVASWSATAIGIYQNPAILKAASAAFWSSCRIISKLM
ncbi:uncharacterized protein LOC103716173 isoform X2 [Phoenix dactylifera]|uniref:Uncharacterized protein LOC103716173 isoform X2 n=1 Tax=Phoenix dactylifera TaxID=42345 RepID=A0A8B7CMF5_PHODC|nr:uncharacterized protein LOC103716173 isoform X2 [Phoenix dactylifera]